MICKKKNFFAKIENFRYDPSGTQSHEVHMPTVLFAPNKIAASGIQVARPNGMVHIEITTQPKCGPQISKNFKLGVYFHVEKRSYNQTKCKPIRIIDTDTIQGPKRKNWISRRNLKRVTGAHTSSKRYSLDVRRNERARLSATQHTYVFVW